MRQLRLNLKTILPFVFACAIVSTGCGGGSSTLKSSSAGQTSTPTANNAGGSSGTNGSNGNTGSGSSPSNGAPKNATTIYNIQNRAGWENCSAKNASGGACASGMGQADAWMAQFQTTPSMSGSSGEFHVGGGTGYSNNLWWNQLGTNHSASHFIYDFWVYMKDADRPQALEFDVNQSFGSTRWVFGTECNFDGTGKWDVWDGSGGVGKWIPSKVGCSQFKDNTWTHVVWKFERNDAKVHYISVAINGTEYPVDMWQSAQLDWHADEVNVAVQLDGNHAQQPYEVWVDDMALTYW